MSHCRLLPLLAACALTAAGAPELAPLFQENGVLQCEKPVSVWGRATPGEHLSVSFAGQTVGTTVGPDGRWIAVLAPLAASPLGSDLVVAGKETVTVRNILVGEVWLCSGGSGMESTAPADSAAQYPLIRVFKVTRRSAAAPQEQAEGAWKTCSPETAGHFTAIGTFFARDLFARMGLPVAIIDSSSPASSLEEWMSPAALAPFAASLPPANPARSGLFNAMIHPLLPYAVRGVIWYQGEADVGRASDYAVRFPALVTAWRSHFGEGDLPFLWVQLPAPRFIGNADAWARLREAQSKALALPETGQAIAADVGESGKREIARRLALIAKAAVYSIPVDYSGPAFSGFSIEGASIRVRFNFAGEGLTASGKPLQSFELAGADRIFRPATALIQGDTVVVRSGAVKQPVAVRYAWRAAEEGNLFNGAGLPASPFRSDDW